MVDTGIHWKRWTREQAIDYMVGIDLIALIVEFLFEYLDDEYMHEERRNHH